jgi:hypothetical protein
MKKHVILVQMYETVIKCLIIILLCESVKEVNINSWTRLLTESALLAHIYLWCSSFLNPCTIMDRKDQLYGRAERVVLVQNLVKIVKTDEHIEDWHIFLHWQWKCGIKNFVRILIWKFETDFFKYLWTVHLKNYPCLFQVICI